MSVQRAALCLRSCSVRQVALRGGWDADRNRQPRMQVGICGRHVCSGVNAVTCGNGFWVVYWLPSSLGVLCGCFFNSASDASAEDPARPSDCSARAAFSYAPSFASLTARLALICSWSFAVACKERAVELCCAVVQRVWNCPLFQSVRRSRKMLTIDAVHTAREEVPLVLGSVRRAAGRRRSLEKASRDSAELSRAFAASHSTRARRSATCRPTLMECGQLLGYGQCKCLLTMAAAVTGAALGQISEISLQSRLWQTVARHQGQASPLGLVSCSEARRGSAEEPITDQKQKWR